MQTQQQIAQQIAQLLANTSVTFAQVQYVTQVATAAAHKHVKITKHTTANVQLFSNIAAATSVFANAVARSATQYASNSAAAIAQFAAQSNYFTHTNCYSIVQHKNNNNLYLYCIYNNASSVYYINNALATKQQVAQHLTASAAQQLLNATSTVHNATHNITHNIIVRTIALQNIVSITAKHKQLHFAN
jgi:hypothetical protein